MTPDALEHEIKLLRLRLSTHATIYVARPDGITAAQELKRRGEVICTWGEGEDRGILIVRRSPPKPSPPPGRGGLIA